jgi:Anti-sigma-28 factor, FlgM
MSAESRQAKVNRLKDQIDQGRYHVDARAVAKAILVHERGDTCSASPTACTRIQRRLVERRGVSRCRQGRSYRRPSVISPLRGRKLSLRRRGNMRALLF